MAAFTTYLKRPRQQKCLPIFASVLLLALIVFGYHYISTQEQASFITFRKIVGAGNNITTFVRPGEDTILADGSDSLVFEGSVEGSKIAFRAILSQNDTSTGPLGDKKKPFLLIVVLSEMGKTEERQAVRNSWYNWADGVTTKIVFFLAVKAEFATTKHVEALTGEMNKFNDIVIDNMEEHYFLLTVKVLRMFKWFLRKYPEEATRPKYLIKTDHDVFNHIPALWRHLIVLESSGNDMYIGGDSNHRPSVIRDPSSKWYTPVDMWAEEEYPQFVGGPFYVMSGPVVQLVFESSLDEPLFHLEDVFISGIVANRKLGLKFTQIDTVFRSFTRKGVETNLTFLQNAVALHPFSPKMMMKFYRNYKLFNLI